MTEYPVELPNSPVSGLSADQSAAVFRAPFAVDAASGVHRLGSGYVRNLMTAVGLWYTGSTAFGDWSGTTQTINEDGDPGSGGPAGCPFSTTGDNTVMHAGKIRHKTGNAAFSTTSIPTDRDFRVNIATDPTQSLWTFKVALRKMTDAVIGWNSGGSVGSKIAAGVTNDPVIPDCTFTARTPSAQGIIIGAPSGEDFDAYTFTGDDWCAVQKVDPVSGVRGVPGWYRIKGKPAADEIELTADAHVIHTQDTLVDILILQSAQAKYHAAATYYDFNKFTLNDLPVDGDTTTIGSVVHTFRTSPSAATDVQIGADIEETVGNLAAAWEDHPLVSVEDSDDVSVTVRARTAAIYACSKSFATPSEGVWSYSYVAQNAMRKSGAMDALASEDDTLERLASAPHEGRFYKIVGRTADALFFADEADSFNTDTVSFTDFPGSSHNVVHWKRYPFVIKDVDLSNSSKSKVGWTGTLGTSHGWNNDTPKRGDLYLVWTVTTDSTNLQSQTTNPEAVPTLTERNTQVSLWPYWTPGSCRRCSYPGTYPSQLACDEGSQMHTGWFGTFLLPRESFLVGDRLRIKTVSDLQMWGTPCIVEVLIMPGFDPAVDFDKTSGALHSSRGLFNGLDKGIWIQSPPIVDCDNNMGFTIELDGQAGFIQTLGGINESGSNASQQWTATFTAGANTTDPYRTLVGGTGGGANTPATGFPATVGPVAHIAFTDVENMTGLAYPVTVLIKVEHPSMRNRPGYHGYFAQEPFSCTTGNGGHLIHYGGQNLEPIGAATLNADGQFITDLPYGGVMRIATMTVEYVPGRMSS